MKPPQRGELYWANLDPAIGSEIAKTRPALIISNDIGNQYADRVIVFKDGKIKKDYQIENRRDAAEELKRMPEIVDEDDD